MAFQQRVSHHVEALQSELRCHPDLIAEMKEEELDKTNFGNILGWLCSKFNLILDGMYTEEQVNRICQDLIYELKKKQVKIIIPTPEDLV